MSGSPLLETLLIPLDISWVYAYLILLRLYKGKLSYCSQIAFEFTEVWTPFVALNSFIVFDIFWLYFVDSQLNCFEKAKYKVYAINILESHGLSIMVEFAGQIISAVYNSPENKKNDTLGYDT